MFSLYCGCFCISFLGYLISELFDNQRHLAGNFRGFLRSFLLNLLILAVFLLSIYWRLVSMLHIVGQFYSFALVEFLLSEYSCAFFSFLFVFVD